MLGDDAQRAAYGALRVKGCPAGSPYEGPPRCLADVVAICKRHQLSPKRRPTDHEMAVLQWFVDATRMRLSLTREQQRELLGIGPAEFDALCRELDERG